MRHYHVNTQTGYVEAESIGGVPRYILPNCVLQSSSESLPNKPFGDHFYFHWERNQWEDIRTLEQRKLDKWNEIKAERAAREFGTYTINSRTFDIDAASQDRIRSTYQLAVSAKAESEPFSITWILTDNSSITISNADTFINIAKEILRYINSLYETSRLIRTQLFNCTTEAQVDAISWPSS